MLLVWAGLASILVYLSFVGLGHLVSLHTARDDFASAAAFGMALACVIGGILNFVHLISVLGIWILLLSGLGTWIYFLVRKRKKLKKYFALFLCRRKYAFLLLGPLLVLSMLYGTLPVLNPHDDCQGYLVFPHRMLATGHMGDDPFNERRLGVLGGQDFLNAIMLTLVPATQLRTMDATVGWMVFVLLVMNHGYRRKVPNIALVLVLMLWHLHQPPATNLTSLITSLALYYLFLCRFSTPKLHQKTIEVVKTGIVVAALCSLKTTVIEGLGILAIAVFFLDKRLPFLQRIHCGLRVAGVGLLLLLPWMLAMYQSSDTLLFPLLGHGTQTSWQQGAAALSIRAQDISWSYTKKALVDVLAQPFTLTGMLLLLLIFFKRRSLSVNPVAVIAFVAGVLGSLLLSFLTLNIPRYTYPMIFAVVTYLVVETMACRRPFGAWMGWVSLAFYTGLLWPDIPSVMEKRVDSIKKITKNSAAFEVQPETVRRGQQATPAGATIMAVLSHPYLLDFKRNVIVVVDHAGSASPPPGMPLKGTAEELASYLRQQHIDYLLYSYSDEAKYGRGMKTIAKRLHYRGTPYNDRTRVLAENNCRFRDLIGELEKQYPVRFKDDYSLLIDLSVTPK
ncbi:MAG: hypothetical protein ABIJ09_23640 [Pseudomonadota bacterium]